MSSHPRVYRKSSTHLNLQNLNHHITIMDYYQPHAPRVGDVIYKGKTASFDVDKIKSIGKDIGIVTAIRKAIPGELLNYELEVTKADSSIEIAQSQEWRCYRQLADATKAYAAEQERVISMLST